MTPKLKRADCANRVPSVVTTNAEGARLGLCPDCGRTFNVKPKGKARLPLHTT
jgi:ribosome-binding protein aMBF1 (putative translation factor)